MYLSVFVNKSLNEIVPKKINDYNVLRILNNFDDSKSEFITNEYVDNESRLRKVIFYKSYNTGKSLICLADDTEVKKMKAITKNYIDLLLVTYVIIIIANVVINKTKKRKRDDENTLHGNY